MSGAIGNLIGLFFVAAGFGFYTGIIPMAAGVWAFFRKDGDKPSIYAGYALGLLGICLFFSEGLPYFQELLHRS